MKGIIDTAIKKAINKGKSVEVAKRYLKIKYKIKASVNVLKKRITYLKPDNNE